MPSRRKKTDAEKFKELQAKWYKKLAADKKHPDGAFEDIEVDETRLRRNSSELFSYGNEVSWEAKRDYYQMAENFLTDYRFSSNLEQIIWEYHANGISVYNIAHILTKAKIKKTNREEIRLIVKRLRSSMYSMYLTPMSEHNE